MKLHMYDNITAGLFLCSYMCMAILRLAYSFVVTCVLLYCSWSVPLKLHVYGYITAGLFC